LPPPPHSRRYPHPGCPDSRREEVPLCYYATYLPPHVRRRPRPDATRQHVWERPEGWAGGAAGGISGRSYVLGSERAGCRCLEPFPSERSPLTPWHRPAQLLSGLPAFRYRAFSSFGFFSTSRVHCSCKWQHCRRMHIPPPTSMHTGVDNRLAHG